jgi:hypothetical protein
VSLLSHQESGKKKQAVTPPPPLETCCYASFSVIEVFAIVVCCMVYILHVYVNLHWASKSVVGVAEQDLAMVILAAEVRVWACKGGVVIGGAKVAGCACACGLVVPLDLAEAAEEDLVPNYIIV